MMTTPGELYIQKRVGLAAFRRAQAYHRAGAIHGAYREGATLRALCTGSQREPYRVWATLDERRLVVAHCSCPVGASGRCKHVGALLLSWKHRPELFHEHHEAGAALGPTGAVLLEPVLLEVVRSYPELSWLIDARPATGAARSERAEAFQAAARQLLGRGPAKHEALRRLSVLRAAAERALAEGQVGRAALVFEGLVLALLERPSELAEGQVLAGFGAACAAGLSRCLIAEQRDPKVREALIKALYFAFRSGADAGGLPLGAEAADGLVRGTGRSERGQIIRWLQGAVAAAPEGVRQSCGGLWMKLEAGAASNERMLEIAAASGRSVDVVDRLLLLGRVEEAIEALGDVLPGEAIEVAHCLVAHGQRAAAMELLASVPEDERPTDVLDELVICAENGGDLRGALSWALDALRTEPSVERYREARRLGLRLGQWAALRLAIEGWLVGADEEAMLAGVYLDERAYDDAIALARRSSSQEVKEAVAHACSEERPREALDLYGEIIELMVAERGRDGYQQAKPQLKVMKKLHEQVGNGPAWSRVAARLRSGSSLRAAG